VYDRARSRSNRGEAEALAATVVERLLDPVRCDTSIGIVTFSAAQQTLIEDLLDEACRAYPQIERPSRAIRSGSGFGSPEDEFLRVSRCGRASW
jgi:hypothetical protein